jgi:penicillin amidase
VSSGRQRPARSLLAVLAVGLLVALALGVLRARERAAERAAWPLLEGKLQVRGLEAPLEILRDDVGVPHVLARSEADAWFGLGFAHAQDRLAQMLWLRRLARGRSAEVVGAAGLASDRLTRTLGLGQRADSEVARLGPRAQAALEAYTRGVNAHIARIQEGAAAAPLAVARAEIPVEAWHVSDSLAVLALHAWALSDSLEASLVLDELLGRLGGVAARPFFPGSEADPLPLPARPPLTARRWEDPARRALGLEGRSAGSTAWVVAGSRSASGAPLLAADSHVEPTTPPLFYLAHLRGGGLDVAGSTLPGVAGFWSGHNRQVAWASTSARAVVMDLYTEVLQPDGSPFYHDGHGWRPLRERSETLEVRGAEAERLVVRSTRRGPLVEALLGGARDPVALAWVGLEGGCAETVGALVDVAAAGDAPALLAGLARVGVPVLAVVYADASGAAGLQVAGWIPSRALSTQLVPVPGRARWYTWSGHIPFSRLPAERVGEGRGWAIAADNALAQPDADPRIEWLWRDGARARRIDAALGAAAARGPLKLGQLVALQADVVENRGHALAEAALDLAQAGGPLDAEAQEVAEMLRGWDGQAAADSAGAAAFYAFEAELAGEVLRPLLGEDLLRRYLALSQADPGELLLEIVQAAARGEAPEGWPEPGQVREAVRASLRQTWFQLSYRLGGGRARWRWGRLHQLDLRAFVPGAADVGLGRFEVGGSGSTVNTSEYALAAPYDVVQASLFRFAVDLAAPDESRALLAPGQSEHPGSRHRADQIEPWLRGTVTTLRSDDAFAESGAGPRLWLEPQP